MALKIYKSSKKADSMKNIAFFSKGFAFNRLVRLRYYEKIFPKNVNIFLITTDTYGDYKKWNLSRTKILVLKNNPLKNIFEIRKFCRANNISTLSNLGHPFGAIPLILASLFEKRDVLLYILGDSIDYPKLDTLTKSGLKYLFSLIPYFFIEKFCKKTAIVGYNSYKKAPYFFISPRTKFRYMHAPVNTTIFHPVSQSTARKKTSISKKDDVVVYVGRITKRKGGELLKNLILSNPNIKFVLIGNWIESEVPKFKSPNLTHIESVDNHEISSYYSSADIVFAYHRQGCQMGIVGAEALSCGVPIIHTNRIAFKDSPAILKVSDDLSEVNEKLRSFFKKSIKEKNQLRKEARKYAEKYCSDEVWKDSYLEFYLH